MWMWVKFINTDPTKGAYNQLPLATVNISDKNTPKPIESGVWVLMTKPALRNYIEQVRLKSEILTLSPNTSGVIDIKPVDISKMNAEEIDITKNRLRRDFGNALIHEAIDELGGRNVFLGKTGSFIVQMLTDLQPIAALIQNGALKTAYGALLQVSPKYPEYIDVFVDITSEIKIFLQSIGDW